MRKANNEGEYEQIKLPLQLTSNFISNFVSMFYNCVTKCENHHVFLTFRIMEVVSSELRIFFGFTIRCLISLGKLPVHVNF